MKTSTRGGLFAFVSVFALLSSLLASDPTPREETKPLPRFSPVEYCESLDHLGREAYIRRLAAEKQVAALKAIAESRTESAGYAVCQYGMTMPTKELLPYFKTLSPLSQRWTGLLWTLLERDEKAVLPYLHQVMKKEGLVIRCHCYEICQRTGTPDLAPYAMRDASSTHLFPRTNGFIAETCGSIAQRYLDSLSTPKPASGAAN